MQLLEKDLLELAGWQVVKQARTLVAAGSVSKALMEVRNDGSVHFKGEVVEGRRRHVAVLMVHSLDNAQNHCNCPVARRDGKICPHSIAVALFALKNEFHKNTKNKKQVTEDQHDAEDSDGLVEVVPIPAFDYDSILERFDFPVEFYPVNQVRDWKAEVNAGVLKSIAGLGLANNDSPKFASLDKSAFLNLLSAFRGNCWPTSYLKESKGVWKSIRVCSMATRIPIVVSTVLDKPELAQIEIQSIKDGGIIADGANCWILRISDQIAIPTNLSQITPSLFNDVEPLFNSPPGETSIQIELSKLRSEAETLFDVFHMECSGQLTLRDLLQKHTGVPNVSMSVEGSLRQLNIIVKFTYQKDEQPNPEIEFRALESLPEIKLQEVSGKSSGTVKQFSGILQGQDSILNFYAGSLAKAISSDWNVEIGSRFANIVKDIERVRPRISPQGDVSNNWLSFDLEFSTAEGHQISEKEIRRLVSTGSSKIKLPSGKFAAFNRSQIEGIFDSLSFSEGEQMMNPSSGKTTRKIPTLFYESLVESEGSLITDSSQSMPIKHPPDSFSGQLRHYQLSGVNWLLRRSQSGYGAILADEMGLGKTVQVLALIGFLQDASISNSETQEKGLEKRTCMIVCPTSLIHTWKSEIERFLPTKQALVLHGPGRNKLFQTIKNTDIVITSYGSLCRDLSHYENYQFPLVVADEASVLKNPRSQVAKSLSTISSGSRIALSGTPIENTIQDLWSVMNFANPGYLDHQKSFLARYSSASEESMKGLRRRIAPFILRRTKREVASELPSKIEKIIYCELNRQQLKAYEELIKLARNNFKKSRNDLINNDISIEMLVFLLRLRQVCCDYRLLPKNQDEELPSTGLNLKKTNAKQVPNNVEQSSKLKALETLLAYLLASGSRILIFSQFVSMLSLIRKMLDEKGISYCYIDGAQNSTQRSEQVDAFQDARSKIPVFLMSLKAGGYGLTLTAADSVIHFDPWWNPAVEAQATDRAHRIGQTKTVTSYKLIVEGSVEQKIMQLQTRKQRIADSIIDDRTPLMNGLSREDIQFILS